MSSNPSLRGADFLLEKTRLNKLKVLTSHLPKLVALSMLLLSVLLGIGCGSSLSEVTEPRPQIIQVTARDSSADNTYTIFIDCRVRNEGASGSIVVAAEMKNGNSITKRKTISISGDQTQEVTFSFPEAILFETRLAEYQFNCNIES